MRLQGKEMYPRLAKIKEGRRNGSDVVLTAAADSE